MTSLGFHQFGLAVVGPNATEAETEAAASLQPFYIQEYNPKFGMTKEVRISSKVYLDLAYSF